MSELFSRSSFITLLASALGAQKQRLNYLELGTAHNETIEMVARLLPLARCIGVDRRVIDPGLPNVTMYEMDTQTYLLDYAKDDAPFDLVYIDADHAFTAVRQDFEAVWPYVGDQSLVCLDDTWPDNKENTAPGLSGTAHLMADWLEYRYEHVTIPANPGLTIVRKALYHLPWGHE